MKSCSSSQSLIEDSVATQHPGAIYTSRPISALITAVASSKRRKIEQIDLETCNNDGKNYTSYLNFV